MEQAPDNPVAPEQSIGFKPGSPASAGWIIWSILAALWIIGAMIAPNFITVQNLSNVLIKAIPVILVSLSQAVVLLVACFDFTVGSVVSLVTVIMSHLADISIPLAVAASLLAAVAIGLINGFGVVILRVNSVIMTFGMLYVVQGISFYFRPYPGGLVPFSFVDFLGFKYAGFPVVSAGLCALICLTLLTFVYKRQIGQHLYATGANEEVAQRVGIRTTRLRVTAYVVSAVLAGLAGLFVTAVTGTGDALIGQSYLFQSFIVALLGGMAITGGRGNLFNVIGAGLIVATLSSLLNHIGVNNWYQDVMLGALLLVVLGVRSLYSTTGGDG